MTTSPWIGHHDQATASTAPTPALVHGTPHAHGTVTQKGQQRVTPEHRTSLGLGRPHKILIGLVIAGALIIASIGFAGSYEAVRELALQKGFGNFSYVFPIGIDAGICVLLALDLLLTWIRIPFPLLRQTAWLLTVATIAFNGAAAWPNPLGVGMHAVIPVLFVVAVEAARHAIGQIADITADKHMERVRLTRWLLSPIPTFLLWRRMKLWELRSYQQAIKLEQDRLVYQARLHSRFGRAWRRKAPVESLMPLRLARYGVPLAETAPAGLAAAGIEPAPQPPAPALTPVQASVPAAAEALELEANQAPAGHFQQASEHSRAQAQTGMQAQEQMPLAQMPAPARRDASDLGVFADAYQSWVAQFLVAPTPGQFALFLRDRFATATAAGDPLSDEQLSPILASLQQRYEPTTSTAARGGHVGEDVDWQKFLCRAWIDFAHEYGSYPDAAALAQYVFERDGITTAAGEPLVAQDLHAFVHAFQQRNFGEGRPPMGETVTELGKTKEAPEPAPTVASPTSAGTHAAKEMPGPKANAAIDKQHPSASQDNALTVVDQYYLAWRSYQNEHGQEPTDKQLSTSLAHNGVSGRSGNPISPSTLRRYFLPFRLYHVWADHRTGADRPTAESVVKDCADRGITAQYNRPITVEDIAKQANDFERRWRAIIARAGDM